MDNYKILITGPRNSGKSSYIERLDVGTYSEEYTPSSNFKVTGLNIIAGTSGKPYSNDFYPVLLWDSGDINIYDPDLGYTYETNGIAMCFDITRPQDYDEIIPIIKVLFEKIKKPVPVTLLGMKMDLLDQARDNLFKLKSIQDEISELTKVTTTFILVSPKTFTNIEESMNNILRMVTRNKDIVWKREGGEEAKKDEEALRKESNPGNNDDQYPIDGYFEGEEPYHDDQDIIYSEDEFPRTATRSLGGFLPNPVQNLIGSFTTGMMNVFGRQSPPQGAPPSPVLEIDDYESSSGVIDFGDYTYDSE